MKKANEWETRADNALNSLEGIVRPVSNPFLYTRIKARLAENQTVWSKAADFIAKPLVAFTLAAIFVGVNVWAVTQHPEHKTAARPEQAFDQDFATVNYSLGENNINEK